MLGHLKETKEKRSFDRDPNGTTISLAHIPTPQKVLCTSSIRSAHFRAAQKALYTFKK
jgi:hypothetical protein